MKVVLKVIRCHINKYRLGYHLPKFANNNMQNVKSVDVVGITKNTLNITNLDWYRQYGTIENKEISQWIINNHWDRQPYAPIQLLLFDLTINNNKHVLTFISSSKYKKKSNCNMLTIDNGVTYIKSPSDINQL